MDSKPWYLSRAIWGGVIAAIAGGLGLLGFAFPDQFVELMSNDLVQVIESAIIAGAGVLAIVGRIKAVKKITK